MKILFYNCFAGISGDMNLAAMIDLGVDADYLRSELSKLGLDHEFELRISPDYRKGIRGTRVDVLLTHDHGHHDNAHSESKASHGHAHHDDHRNLKDIEGIILASNLGETVKKTSLSIFRKLAEAEAKVHGKNLYEIHFHEVGATDAIVDIVGAAICYHHLDVDEVWASPVELGGGFVTCAHGVMPVPTPATSEILTGIPTTRGAVPKEMTTPTGAAILSVLADRFTSSPAFSVEKTAYGIGHRETEIPNLLRVQLAQASGPSESWDTVEAFLLQCNIDDMTAEMLGVVLDLLMNEGAHDVHFTPVVMKKNRPATCLSVLCAGKDLDRFKRLLFKHTTTLGIKCFSLEKNMLRTRFETLETPLGSVTMKNAVMDGKVIRSKPELEECKKIAEAHDISLGEVYYRIGKCRK